MEENQLACDLFELCDLKLMSTFGGMFAEGFSSLEIIEILKLRKVKKALREDTLRRLKIMGSASAEVFNQKMTKTDRENS